MATISTIKAERLPEALKAFILILRVAPKPRGPHQKRIRTIIDQGLRLLQAVAKREQTANNVALFNHLLGAALGIGAITESQCSRIMLLLVEEEVR